MKLLEVYLLYLLLNEREWNAPSQNPDTFSKQKYVDLMIQNIGNQEFNYMRHSLQPSMYDLYIKNALGDYMGRPDMMNSITMRHVGFSQFLKDLKVLKQRIKFAQKIKDKVPPNFKVFEPKETSDLLPDYDEGEGEGGGFGGGGDGGGGG